MESKDLFFTPFKIIMGIEREIVKLLDKYIDKIRIEDACFLEVDGEEEGAYEDVPHLELIVPTEMLEEYKRLKPDLHSGANFWNATNLAKRLRTYALSCGQNDSLFLDVLHYLGESPHVIFERLLDPDETRLIVEGAPQPEPEFDEPDILILGLELVGNPLKRPKPFKPNIYGEKPTEPLIEPLVYNKNIGCYQIVAFVPGLKRKDITVSLSGRILTIMAGDYKKDIPVPASVREKKIIYSTGKLDIRLT